MNKEKLLLLVAAVGLLPIALSYGLSPSQSLSMMFNFDASSLELTHIFRAVMGLYLMTAAYWVFGAFNSNHTVSAIRNLVIFMLGLAFGRILSIAIDGNPNYILWLYLILEMGFGVVGIIVLKKNNT